MAKFDRRFRYQLSHLETSIWFFYDLLKLSLNDFACCVYTHVLYSTWHVPSGMQLCCVSSVEIAYTDVLQSSSQRKTVHMYPAVLDTSDFYRQESVAAVQSITNFECLVSKHILQYAPQIFSVLSSSSSSINQSWLLKGRKDHSTLPYPFSDWHQQFTFIWLSSLGRVPG